MAEKGYKFRRLEEQYGNLNNIIPRMVNELGQAETAKQLGCSQFSIGKWLKDHGYKAIITYIKTDEPIGEKVAS